MFYEVIDACFTSDFFLFLWLILRRSECLRLEDDTADFMVICER
jgi:hypothetical protein